MTNEEAIKIIKAECYVFNPLNLDRTQMVNTALDTACKALEQESKRGHWEFIQYDSNPNIGNWHCSECNRLVCGAIKATDSVYAYKYCPNCGARMAESEDKE